MNVARIYHIMKTDKYTKSVFSGIGNPDVDIEIDKLPALFFLNTDLSDSPGEHWCVAYFVDKHTCEFFDPYGLGPKTYNLRQIISPHCKVIIGNVKQVQAFNEKTCGHHCLFFSLYRCRKVSFNDIMTKLYSSDINKNDKKVFKALQKFGVVMSHIQDV